MGQANFEALVDTLERRYAGRDRALARRTMLVVGLGYAGFLLWVLSIAAIGIAACVGALFAPLEVGVCLVVVGAVVLSAALWQAFEVLWLPGCESKQVRLTASQAPELFALLERLRRELRTPPIHRVELALQMNAGIRQIARLGILGWSRNELYLGLPLMDLLAPREFESVLAHEYAHISARHGKFGAWIYRTRSTWLQLFARLQQPSGSSLSKTARSALVRFVDWYWPRFHAYFFVMSRAQEYVADRAAANWAGADAAAQALWKLDLCSRRLDQRFWPELTRAALATADPPAHISERIRDYLKSPAAAADATQWSQQAAAGVTDTSDTHPSLADRVAGLGGSLAACQALGWPQPASPSAAEQLFGARLEEMRALVDQNWCNEVREMWRARHHRSHTVQRRGQELDQAPERPELDVAALWERACGVLELEGPEVAAPLLRQILAARPTHPGANLALGQYLLARGENEGETLLRKMIERTDGELVAEACQSLATHYQATGQSSELRRMNEFLGRFQADRLAAQRERSAVTAQDTFLLHGLEAGELASLCEVLHGDRELAEAYLVRKELKFFAHQKLFVLCVRTRRGFFGRSDPAADQALVERLVPRVCLPGRVLVIPPQGGFRALARKVMAGRDARIEHGGKP